MKLNSNKNSCLSIIKRNQGSFANIQSRLILIGVIAAILFLSNQSLASVSTLLQVGPGRTFTRVQDAAAAAHDGDTIEIDAGTYLGGAAVAVWLASNITVRGVGNGRAHLEANGSYVFGKGTFVAAGNNITFENIEFSGAAVPDHNGAGIRLDGSGLTVRNCYFHDNENGILTASNAQSDVFIENSEFYRNGLGVGCETTGCTHNMYINEVRSFTMRGSWTHGARRGHEVKSRALKNVLLYNRISDEQDGTASYGVNLPEGGDCYLIGNVIEKGANSENGSAIVTFGEDALNQSPIQQLTLVNNTIVDDKGVANFVRFDKTPNSATFINNIFVGNGGVSTYAGTTLRNNLAVGQDPGFVNRANYDYHLQANSTAIDAGVAPGSANGVDLTPVLQYLHPAQTETRTLSGTAWDIGAFERPSAGGARNKLFDFDGDGKSDLSVFRPASATWYLQRSQTGLTSIPFGISTDKIVPADYDGDGKTDVAVFRNGTWYLLRSQLGLTVFQFGQAGDIPVPADYDGDGRADYAVFRGGVWYIQRSTLGFTVLQFGVPTDKPVPADYDGDGKTDVAVFRNGTWYLLRSQLGFTALQFGISGDQPVVGDYDGDSKADIAVYRGGTWYLNRSSNGFFSQQFGLSTDVPAAADYDGDNKTDIAVFRDGIWYLQRSTNGVAIVQYGINGDQPIPAAYVP